MNTHARNEFLLQVGRELLQGRLSISEAMERGQIKDKRTMIKWAKRSLDQLPPEDSTTTSVDNISTAAPKMEQVVSAEEEVVRLKAELDTVKARNAVLLRFQNTLTNRINDLEVLIEYAERTHGISIYKISKRKT